MPNKDKSTTVSMVYCVKKKKKKKPERNQKEKLRKKGGKKLKKKKDIILCLCSTERKVLSFLSLIVKVSLVHCVLLLTRGEIRSVRDANQRHIMTTIKKEY